jgi:lipopolysaccharide transport system permease protein
MYATPVVYPLGALPDHLRPWLRFNPATGVVEAFRACVLGGPWPAEAFAWAAALALLLVAGGAALFKRVERSLADVL